MYQVTITKIETVKSVDRSYEILADTGNERDNGRQYGYVEYPSEKSVDTKIYNQSVEDIDLQAVIKAVNNIE